MRFALFSTALLATALSHQAAAQGATRQSFEGADPFGVIPSAAPFSAISSTRVGDTGVFTNASGITAADGTQFAVLSTFSDGGGTYAAGSPLFGGAGAIAGPNNLWNFAFPGSAANSLIPLAAASGSVLTLSISLDAGQSVHAKLAYATSEVGVSDIAWVGVRPTGSTEPTLFQEVTPSLGSLSPTPITVLNFDSMSPWFGFSFVAPSTNTYTLAFGIADRGSEGGQSALFVDMVSQVPEPGTWAAIAGGAALGAALLVRRRRSS